MSSHESIGDESSSDLTATEPTIIKAGDSFLGGWDRIKCNVDITSL
jgi:hypothetical protein